MVYRTWIHSYVCMYIYIYACIVTHIYIYMRVCVCVFEMQDFSPDSVT